MGHTKSPLHPIKEYTAKKKKLFYFTIIELKSSHLSILKSFWFTFVLGVSEVSLHSKYKKGKTQNRFLYNKIEISFRMLCNQTQTRQHEFWPLDGKKTNTNLLDGRKLAVYLLGFGSVLSKSSQGLGLPFSISRFTNGLSKAHSFHLHCASPTSNIKELLKSQRRMTSNDIIVLVVL